MSVGSCDVSGNMMSCDVGEHVTSVGSCDIIVCDQTPPSHKEKGLVIIEHFLGCAESTVLIPNKPMK